MEFCAKCGNKIEDDHRFCPACGTPVSPPVEDVADTTPHVLEKTARGPEPGCVTPADSARVLRPDSHVDRKTLFEDGMLVLTSENLILYTGDETDELKRIRISSIKSCEYSMLRRGMVVKRRTNEEENFQELLAEKHAKLAHMTHEKQGCEALLRSTRKRDERRRIGDKTAKLEAKISNLSREIRELESDPTKIKRAREKKADIITEFFRLPKDYGRDSGMTAREEYKIWQYAVKRRILGISQIKIETLPYDAIVAIEGEVEGATPIMVEKPLIDASVLNGKYDIKILKEGYETIKFTVTTDLKKGSYMKKLKLSPRTNPDPGDDEMIARMRRGVPDRTIDLSFHSVNREIEGRNELLLLTREEILVMSKDGQQCLFSIPYGAITGVKYDRGFLRGTNAVRITYNEPHFKNIVFDFWIDNSDGRITSAEMRQRSESLAEILNKEKRESHAKSLPTHVHSPRYYTITEQDLEDNFGRFEPFDFEVLVAKLFEKKGYKTRVTQERADLGVDVIAEGGKETIAIQVKHWQAPVGGPDVHKTLGSMITHNATRAMVVTSSDFTNQAYEIQRRGTPVELWNGSRLRDEFRHHLMNAEDRDRCGISGAARRIRSKP